MPEKGITLDKVPSTDFTFVKSQTYKSHNDYSIKFIVSLNAHWY